MTAKPFSSDLAVPVVGVPAAISIASDVAPGSPIAPVIPVAPVAAVTAPAASAPATDGTLVFGTNNTNDGYDQLASFSETSTLSAGGSAYFALEVTTGQSVKLSYQSASALKLTLYDGNGQIITWTPNSIKNIYYYLSTPGTYYLGISSATAGTFSYTVQAENKLPSLALPANPNTATTQNSFYSLLSGATDWWNDRTYTGTVQETSDGVAGARHVITYDFATGADAMGPKEQAAVEQALSYISSLYDITFVQTAAGQGDITYTTSAQGASSAGETLQGFYGSGAAGSTVYINNDSAFGYGEGSDYSPGSYAWMTLIHETGHALGLKHPGNYNAGGGGTPDPWLPASTDNRSWTVMSYNDVSASLTAQTYTYPDGSIINLTTSIDPSTYMMYDFEALQYLYGANTRTTATTTTVNINGTPTTVTLGAAAANQTYHWTTNATLLETAYAIGTNNVIDLSNQTLPSVINLNDGSFSSINERLTTSDLLIGFSGNNPSLFNATVRNGQGQLVTETLFNGVNDFAIAPGSQIDTVKLGAGTASVTCNNDGDTIYCGTVSGSDSIIGGKGNDKFYLGGGADTITGGGGTDLVWAPGTLASYTVTISGSTITLKHGTVTDTLTNVSKIQFADWTYQAGLVQPVVTASTAPHQLVYRQAVQLSTLFTASDSGGSIADYEFVLTPAAGGGHFQVNGIDVGQTVDVSAANVGSVYYVAGSATLVDKVGVRAIDSARSTFSNQPAISLSVVAAQAPVVTINEASVPTIYNRQIAISGLFSVTDATGTADSFVIQDTATGSGAGHIRVNGLDYAAGQKVTVAASDLASAYLITGSRSETDIVSIQALDSIGGTHSSARTFNAVVAATVPPVLTILQPSLSVSVHQQVALSTLFSATEPSGIITGYELTDAAGTAGGHFRVKGVDYAAGATVDINATDLSSATFIVGTGPLTDTISVRAIGDEGTSGAKTIGVHITSAAPPVVAARSGTVVPVTHGQSIALSSIFSVTDPNGLAITEYRFIDNTASAGSGSFVFDGKVLPDTSTPVTVAPSDLGGIIFQSGSGNDLITIQAYNGFSWSTGQSFTIEAPADKVPLVAAHPLAVQPRPSSVISVASLFTTTDADQDPITQYKITLSSSAAGSGFLMLHGVRVSGTTLTISGSDLASVTYTAGTVLNNVSLQAYDGMVWSNIAHVSITGTTISPVLSARASSLSASHLESFSFSNLFSLSDPQNSVTRYDFYDSTPGDGSIEIGGVVQAAQTDIVVAASALSSVSFVTSGSDTLSVRVFDGQNWSARQKVTITGPVDTAPVVTGIPLADQPRPGATVAVSDLFSTADADHDLITQYRVVDTTPGGGTLRRNGVNQGNNSVTVAASDLGSLTFTLGTSDVLSIRAFDGLTWSQAKTVTLTAANLQPTVTALSSVVTASHLQSFAFSDLFTASDPQHSGFTKYDFLDTTPGGGAIVLNGSIQAASTDVIVTADQLADLAFVASGTDVLSVRVWDGYSWSARTKVTITAPPDQVPGITATNSTVQTTIGTVLQVSDLFSASDPDQDPITQYRLQDLTPGAGTLRVGGVNQVNNAAIVTADHLGSVTFTAGKNDQVRISAFDGISWGTWTTLTIMGSPAAAAPLQSILQPVSSPAWGFAAAS